MFTLPAHLNYSQTLLDKTSKILDLEDWLRQARLANWQIDAGALAVFDSSALAFLLHLQRGAIASGARLQIHHAPPQLMQLAGLYGIADLLA